MKDPIRFDFRSIHTSNLADLATLPCLQSSRIPRIGTKDWNHDECVHWLTTTCSQTSAMLACLYCQALLCRNFIFRHRRSIASTGARKSVKTIRRIRMRRRLLKRMAVCLFGPLLLIGFVTAGCTTDFSQSSGNENANTDACTGDCGIPDCNSNSCPDGCCDSNGVCRAGTQDDICGSGGMNCENCLITGRTCENGSCMALGQCTPGDTMECGNCGVRYCDPYDNTWGRCEGEGECAPNQVETGNTCGNCGINERTCTSSCRWADWSCVDEGVCAPGTAEFQGSCGNCGRYQKTCTSSCQWTDWHCGDEGVCSPGAVESGGSCGNCGTNRRTCTSSCLWSNWSCVDEGVCSPGSNEHRTVSCRDCGTQTQRRDCNTSCSWGNWLNVGICNCADVYEWRGEPWCNPCYIQNCWDLTNCWWSECKFACD